MDDTAADLGPILERLKYVLSLGVSILAVPLVAGLHGASGGFHILFLTLAACALTIPLVAAGVLPAVRSQPLPRQDLRAQPVGVGSASSLGVR
jgi:hypothetical protein